MKEDQIPTPEFQEKDVDRLIASFGKTPDPELKDRLHALLQRELENHLILRAAVSAPGSKPVKVIQEINQMPFRTTDTHSEKNRNDISRGL